MPRFGNSGGRPVVLGSAALRTVDAVPVRRAERRPGWNRHLVVCVILLVSVVVPGHQRPFQAVR
jgi:hypothetical protein